MYILKNAWIAIKRNLGRNILIGIIITAISCSVSISLAIKNTAGDLIKNYENSYDKEATLTIDRVGMRNKFDYSNSEDFEKAKDSFNSIEQLTYDDVSKYGDSEYINKYYYTYQVGINGSNIEKVSEEFSFGGKGNREGKGGTQTDFKLIGYSDINAMKEFINGSYKMKEISDDAWTQVFNENYVFINSELATMNNISLNSTITLVDNDGKTYDFIVVGIFEENTDDNESSSIFSSSANSIITGSEYLIKTFNENTNITKNISPVFILNSYDDVEKLQSEMYEKGLSDSYKITTNEESASAAVSSVSNVSSFATTFLVLTLIIGAVVLFIINMINIRERKYEIGVFRTVGISKFKLTMQFLVELLVVAIISLMLGAGVGAVSSKSVGNYLLSNEIASAEEKTENTLNNMGMRDKGQGNHMNINQNVVQAYDSIDANVNITILLELVGIGVLLVIVSSFSAMISIQRFSPLSILKERS